jgi:hypothetical protein
MVFILKNYRTGKYIGVDRANDGIPFETELEKAKVWCCAKDALRYKSMCKYNKGWGVNSFKKRPSPKVKLTSTYSEVEDNEPIDPFLEYDIDPIWKHIGIN